MPGWRKTWMRSRGSCWGATGAPPGRRSGPPVLSQSVRLCSLLRLDVFPPLPPPPVWSGVCCSKAKYGNRYAQTPEAELEGRLHRNSDCLALAYLLTALFLHPSVYDCECAACQGRPENLPPPPRFRHL